ncbi:MAG TPA: hypothetical protein VJ917_12175 [Saprospiraceae bacterium]|nr:hypothetical protein [Saprospiraceae bacterium]
MNTNRRLLFIHFELLVEHGIQKLFKITDELFVFLDKQSSEIPLSIVVMAQQFGQRIHWVELDAQNKEERFNQISFFLGKQHIIRKHDEEFAVFLESEEMDHIIGHINDLDRPCIRITNDLNQEDKIPELFVNLSSLEKENELESEPSIGETNNGGTRQNFEEKILVEKTSTAVKEPVEALARKTLDRLIQSGNRPARLSTLKSYILLNHQDEDIHQKVDEIIQRLNKFHEIDIEEDHIIYNID